MFISWTGANRNKFYPFIKANHYCGLNTAELSHATQELEKVLVGTPKTSFRPPELLHILKTSYFYFNNILYNMNEINE